MALVFVFGLCFLWIQAIIIAFHDYPGQKTEILAYGILGAHGIIASVLGVNIYMAKEVKEKDGTIHI